jgi:alpha-glucuronidase
MDRTVATGTAYIAQYPPAIQKLYESLAVCPDNLLLFFHHVPYTYVLHSGKTVIQHIYDSHFDGAEQASALVSKWEALQGHTDEERYNEGLKLLQYEAGEAVIWRDTICNWIYHLSGIPDQKGRVRTEPRH